MWQHLLKTVTGEERDRETERERERGRERDGERERPGQDKKSQPGLPSYPATLEEHRAGRKGTHGNNRK